MVLWISPWKLFKNSVLAGTIFVLALAAFGLNASILGTRSYWYAWLSFGILLSIMWYFTMTCLLLDLMATLLIASRDLQEGAVVAFGIISIMQVPLVFLFLMYELSPTNQLWLLVACVETKYAENCSTWLTSHKYMMMIPSALSCALHIIILGFTSWYIRHREPTSAALLLDDELEYLDIARKRKEDKKKAKAAKKEQKRKAKEAKEKSRKKRGPTYVWRSGSSGGESDASDPNAPFRDEKKRDQGSNPLSGTVHTDSEEDQVPEPVDLEKQTLPSRSSQSTHTEGELGRRKRRTSRHSQRSSRG
ncbi:hypothetical protein JCM3766R1_001176 [Sporobolomyces carnicolor]